LPLLGLDLGRASTVGRPRIPPGPPPPPPPPLSRRMRPDPPQRPSADLPRHSARGAARRCTHRRTAAWSTAAWPRPRPATPPPARRRRSRRPQMPSRPPAAGTGAISVRGIGGGSRRASGGRWGRIRQRVAQVRSAGGVGGNRGLAWRMSPVVGEDGGWGGPGVAWRCGTGWAGLGNAATAQ
jgi:hypothetical protein